MEFFQVKSVSETLSLIHRHVVPFREPISMPLLEALNKVLAEDIVAGEDVPAFTRSTVDGYAVRAKETFGASDSLPIFLDLVGRIEMGQESREICNEGEAYYVPTGGMLPEGCDSVVMIEHAEEIGDLLNVYRQVAPGENVIRAGDDVKKGSLLFEKGVRL
ncbi:MAG: molybdopterin molybdenumtransferase MoeA, partial [Thermicanus sp.]|nr:molybdopterin molybdenumtransferase MoeA [Thermicanus sp.]